MKDDFVKKDLVFVGTEFGLFVSIDGGKIWAQFKGSRFPAVAVRDLAVHPRDHDLVLATHGRGIWVIDDISPWRADFPRSFEALPSGSLPLGWGELGRGGRSQHGAGPPLPIPPPQGGRGEQGANLAITSGGRPVLANTKTRHGRA